MQTRIQFSTSGGVVKNIYFQDNKESLIYNIVTYFYNGKGSDSIVQLTGDVVSKELNCSSIHPKAGLSYFLDE